jgi:hypothetical protein
MTLLFLGFTALFVLIWIKSNAIERDITTMHESAFTCGTTPLEARKSGCHFDVISYGWYPPQCWDEELYNDFLRSHNWTWLSTEYEPLPVEEVQRGEHKRVLTMRGFHLKPVAILG